MSRPASPRLIDGLSRARFNLPPSSQKMVPATIFSPSALLTTFSKKENAMDASEWQH
jgi:hypothetical protein